MEFDTKSDDFSKPAGAEQPKQQDTGFAGGENATFAGGNNWTAAMSRNAQMFSTQLPETVRDYYNRIVSVLKSNDDRFADTELVDMKSATAPGTHLVVSKTANVAYALVYRPALPIPVTGGRQRPVRTSALGTLAKEIAMRYVGYQFDIGVFDDNDANSSDRLQSLARHIHSMSWTCDRAINAFTSTNARFHVNRTFDKNIIAMARSSYAQANPLPAMWMVDISWETEQQQTQPFMQVFGMVETQQVAIDMGNGMQEPRIAPVISITDIQGEYVDPQTTIMALSVAVNEMAGIDQKGWADVFVAQNSDISFAWHFDEKNALKTKPELIEALQTMVELSKTSVTVDRIPSRVQNYWLLKLLSPLGFQSTVGELGKLSSKDFGVTEQSMFCNQQALITPETFQTAQLNFLTAVQAKHGIEAAKEALLYQGFNPTVRAQYMEQQGLVDTYDFVRARYGVTAEGMKILEAIRQRIPATFISQSPPSYQSRIQYGNFGGFEPIGNVGGLYATGGNSYNFNNSLF